LAEWVIRTRRDLSLHMRRRMARQLISDAALREADLHKQQPSKHEIGLRESKLAKDLSGAVQQTVELFVQRLRYLGPLRSEPRAIYGFPASPESRDIGLKGQYVASVLEQHKDVKVTYPVPPTSDIEVGTSRQGSLIQGITEWLKHMGLVEDIATRDRGKMGYELTVHSPGIKRSLDLTNVGVGVSQVLPTLTMALLAPKNAVLLFEQPELHLHPRVQSILGDFFLALALMGSQCIVETHSEYIVNRIRRRIAEAEGTTLSDLTSIYFVELEGGASQFRRVEANKYGAILEWPKGFFDEGPSEAQLIMQAAMGKRTKSRAETR